MPDAKISFIEVRTRHHFDLPELAKQAEVSTATIQRMLIGVPVPRQDAQRILAVVSFLSKTTYTLDTVDIKIEEAHAATTKPTRQPE